RDAAVREDDLGGAVREVELDVHHRVGDDGLGDERWRAQVARVSGRCITATAGTDLVDLADRLHDAGRQSSALREVAVDGR
ncbi:hypothetical protein ACWEPL_62775, partial [Nonomuraea sp. NPDC004186]